MPLMRTKGPGLSLATKTSIIKSYDSIKILILYYLCFVLWYVDDTPEDIVMFLQAFALMVRPIIFYWAI
jgi:hypothetical protein